MVKNLESPGLSGKVDSTVIVTQVGRLSNKKTARASTRLIENELLTVR